MQNQAVVIAGGGPTGLMLAAELALAGIEVVVIERRLTQEVDGARSRGLHARSLEVLDQRGVAGRFLAEGPTMQTNGYAFIPLDLADFPSRHPHGLALLQGHVERLLAAWAAELGVPIRRGLAVTDLAQDEAGVDVHLSDGSTLRAAYLVGCDGGRSVVRRQAGIDFPGWDASVSYLIAELQLDDDAPWGLRRDARGVHAIGKLPDGRASLVLREDEVRQGDQPTLDEVRQALVGLYGRDFGARAPTWISRFSDLARQAARYREGRVLLAGDAAHVHSPTGGMGLNTGLQDAVNLGWKLGQVVRGVSPATLLDTYHAERHPVAARVLRLTLAQTALSRGDARTEALREDVAEILRMDEPRRRFAGLMSGLDLRYDLGPGHPLLGRRMPDLDLVTEAGPTRVFQLLHAARPVLLNLGPPLALGAWTERVRQVEGRYAGVWELPVVGEVAAPTAVLVRPDGHVAWVGEGSDAGLRDALARWFGD